MTLVALSFVVIGAGLAWLWNRPGAAPAPRASGDFFPQIAVEHASDGLLVTNMKGIILWVNAAYCDLFGYGADEMIGRHPLSFALLPEDRPDSETLAQFDYRDLRHEADALQVYENIKKDGTIFWNQISVSFHRHIDGNEYAVLVCRDVTASIEKERELKVKSRELAHLAAHDTLTGVANRAKMAATLERALASAAEDGSFVGVLHIDLDHFKKVNDSHGHRAGDAILIAITRRIQHNIRSTDLLARIGGDEFVVICEGLQELSDLETIGNNLSRAVNGTISWHDITLPSQISIGAAMSGDLARTGSELLSQSDTALYEVKRNGRGGVAMYDEKLHTRVLRETSIKSDLRQAVAQGQVTFQFRPAIAVETGAVSSVQVTPVWQRSGDETLSGEDLMTWARKADCATRIEWLAIDAAARVKRHLDQSGYEDITLRVQLSWDTLMTGDPIEQLTDALLRGGVAPDHLIIDLHETVAFDGNNNANLRFDCLEMLRSIGVQTCLDNFGRGHIGLTHLTRLPIGGVRINRKLTATLRDDPITEKIFVSLCSLGAELGLAITAKGVDDEDTAQSLARLGCDHLQGAWVAPDLAEDALIPWLTSRTDCPRLASPLSKGQLIA